MKIKIIALGKIKEDFLKNGISEFTKRVKPYVPLEIVEIPPIEIKDNNLIKKTLDEEADKILSYIKEQDYVITLEICGKQFSSEEFSSKLSELINSGLQEVVFVIGSSCGLSNKVSQRADLIMSMSKMTFLHQFARLFLIEQIYRAFKIMRAENYHK